MLDEAVKRGEAARRHLLTLEGGCISVTQVAGLLGGMSHDEVRGEVSCSRLLAVEVDGDLQFPIWQFSLPKIDQVVSALGALDPWMKLAFFLESNAATGGDTPMAALRQRKWRDVLRAAKLHGEHGAV